METLAPYTVPFTQFVDLVALTVSTTLSPQGVELTTETCGEGLLFNTQASLVMFILSNFIRTTVETAHTKQLRLTVRATDTGARFEVTDCTRALADQFRCRLITPPDSAAWQEAALRMAVSEQLASDLGGNVRFQAEESTFVLGLEWGKNAVERASEEAAATSSFALACAA